MDTTSGLTTPVALSNGLALAANGYLWSWGSNGGGGLGIGTTTGSSSSPVRVVSLITHYTPINATFSGGSFEVEHYAMGATEIVHNNGMTITVGYRDVEIELVFNPGSGTISDIEINGKSIMFNVAATQYLNYGAAYNDVSHIQYRAWFDGDNMVVRIRNIDKVFTRNAPIEVVATV